tara:strand:+ start:1148 stop:3145 length:1998 start_codon:yes stop_codon:yes gene_type:complete
MTTQAQSYTDEEIFGPQINQGQGLSDDEIFGNPPPPEPEEDFSDQVMNALSSAGDAIANMTVDDVLQYLKENGSLPGGIGGSIAGAITGFLTPLPGGAVMGAILGGGLGSGGGSVASDIAMDRDVDVVKALTEAGMSVGIDVATLGLGKFVGKPIWEGIKKAVRRGDDPKEIVKQLARGDAQPLIEAGKGAKRILPERAESQTIADAAGLSLTPSQLGPGGASKWEITKELIGRTGFLSKNVFENTQDKIKDLVQTRMRTLIGSGEGITDDVLGRGLMEAMQEGRNATMKAYGDGLQEISSTVGKGVIDLNILKGSLRGFVNRREYKDALGNSKLNKKTQDVIGELSDLMGDNTKASGKFLLDFEQALNKKINEVATFGPNFDPTVARELTDLSKKIKVVTRREISKIDKEAGLKFRRLQNSYGKNMGTIYPEINQNFITNAGKGGYSSLGAMFAQPGKLENVQAIMKSIDHAYKQIGKDTSQLSFKTAQEAKNAVAQGYIQKVIPNATRPDFDIKDFQQLAKDLKDPTEAKKVKAILGKGYSSFRRTVNLMSHASEKPQGGLATLFLRSKEYTAVGGLGAAAATGLMPATTAAVSAGTILLGPVFMARAAVNPKHVNKLIKIDQLGNKTEKAMKLTSVLINDIVDEMYAEGMSEDNIIKALKGN